MKLATASTLITATRLLDVSEKYLHRLEPIIAAMLVTKVKEGLHEPVRTMLKRAFKRIIARVILGFE
ncbi:hypothetical protein AB4Y40_36780 [Paraburkholderia sp. EG287B]|uniref:hypothetical protein n=1 Tax=unclassified Paraburkholderia TaxID=2615204 RepID=UPI0034D38421